MWMRTACVVIVLLVAGCGQTPEPQDRYTIVIVEKESSSDTPRSTTEGTAKSTFADVLDGSSEPSSSPDSSTPPSEPDGPDTPEDPDDPRPNDPDDPADPGDPDGEWTIVPRDLEAECLFLGEYFHDCGMFSDAVYEQFEAICTSSTVSPGMKAGTIACTLQLTCGAEDLPQCFHDGIEPECAADADCGDGVCMNEVCYELQFAPSTDPPPNDPQDPTETCLHVGYRTGTPDVTSEVVVGSTCAHGNDCASGRCVEAESHDDPTLDRSWCANKGDCRTPDNADQECPAGFTCTEVLEYVIEENPRWLCVPDTIDVCAPLF